MLSASIDLAREASISSCIEFDCEMLAKGAKNTRNDGVQAKIMIFALENFYDLETSSLDGAISK